MATIRYLPEARDDLDAAYTEYEARAAGLGDRFLDALHRTAAQLETFPAMYGEVAPNIRAALLRRFPYVAYYRIEGEEVIVIAIGPGREDSAVWQGRG